MLVRMDSFKLLSVKFIKMHTIAVRVLTFSLLTYGHTSVCVSVSENTPGCCYRPLYWIKQPPTGSGTVMRHDLFIDFGTI